jgi:hypothetical protein
VHGSLIRYNNKTIGTCLVFSILYFVLKHCTGQRYSRLSLFQCNCIMFSQHLQSLDCIWFLVLTNFIIFSGSFHSNYWTLTCSANHKSNRCSVLLYCDNVLRGTCRKQQTIYNGNEINEGVMVEGSYKKPLYHIIKITPPRQPIHCQFGTTDNYLFVTITLHNLMWSYRISYAYV